MVFSSAFSLSLCVCVCVRVLVRSLNCNDLSDSHMCVCVVIAIVPAVWIVYSMSSVVLLAKIFCLFIGYCNNQSPLLIPYVELEAHVTQLEGGHARLLKQEVELNNERRKKVYMLLCYQLKAI